MEIDVDLVLRLQGIFKEKNTVLEQGCPREHGNGLEEEKLAIDEFIQSLLSMISDWIAQYTSLDDSFNLQV